MAVMDSIIGWLAPPLCVLCGAEGATICEGCSIAAIIPFGERCFNCNALSPGCSTCKSCRRSGSPRRVWVVTDYEGVAKDLIQKYKFGHQRVAAKPMARIMSETFMEFNSDKDIKRANYLVVPVPTATSRARVRGFDHSALLAAYIARHLKLKNSNVMARLGQSRQVGMSRVERLKNAEGKYKVSDHDAVNGRNILLIDDVVTTGATINSASKALRLSGAKTVDALIFAKRL
jgi:competence protein ComFC